MVVAVAACQILDSKMLPFSRLSLLVRQATGVQAPSFELKGKWSRFQAGP